MTTDLDEATSTGLGRQRRVRVYQRHSFQLVVIFAFLLIIGMSHYVPSRNPTHPAIDDRNNDGDLPEDPYWDDPYRSGMRGILCNPIHRYEVTYGKAAAWPSTGGVWIKQVTPVELHALGLSRFNTTEKSDDPALEDLFSTRLQTFGASFYDLPPKWPEGMSWCEDIDDCAEAAIKLDVEVAFPATGGAWILDRSHGWESRFGALYNALDMEERCEVIKSVGGEFCEDITACLKKYAHTPIAESVRELK